MTKIPTPTEKSKKQRENATKNFDYTRIAERIRKVSLSNDNHSTGLWLKIMLQSFFNRGQKWWRKLNRNVTSSTVYKMAHTYKYWYQWKDNFK